MLFLFGRALVILGPWPTIKSVFLPSAKDGGGRGFLKLWVTLPGHQVPHGACCDKAGMKLSVKNSESC